MLLDRQARWRDANRDKLATRDKRNYEKDKSKFYANNARRRARELQAAPSWLTKEQWRDMAEMYADAQRITEMTGISHDVDHIWPLKGRGSCGLHVPWNLQIISSEANNRKANKDPLA
jgi:5-methylcytosine-specific restriction endonuclease McrA